MGISKVFTLLRGKKIFPCLVTVVLLLKNCLTGLWDKSSFLPIFDAAL